MDRYQKTGNYLVWTEGEYSDYRWEAFFRVLKDFNFVELVEEWARHVGIEFDKELEYALFPTPHFSIEEVKIESGSQIISNSKKARFYISNKNNF